MLVLSTVEYFLKNSKRRWICYDFSITARKIRGIKCCYSFLPGRSSRAAEGEAWPENPELTPPSLARAKLQGDENEAIVAWLSSKIRNIQAQWKGGRSLEKIRTNRKRTEWRPGVYFGHWSRIWLSLSSLHLAMLGSVFQRRKRSMCLFICSIYEIIHFGPKCCHFCFGWLPSEKAPWGVGGTAGCWGRVG